MFEAFSAKAFGEKAASEAVADLFGGMGCENTEFKEKSCALGVAFYAHRKRTGNH